MLCNKNLTYHEVEQEKYEKIFLILCKNFTQLDWKMRKKRERDLNLSFRQILKIEQNPSHNAYSDVKILSTFNI